MNDAVGIDGMTCPRVEWHASCGTGEDASRSKNVMNQSQGRPAAPEDWPTKAPEELRTLAAWYRDYAERAGSTLIWDYRLNTAGDLERQASALELRVNRFQ